MNVICKAKNISKVHMNKKLGLFLGMIQHSLG